MGQNMKIRVAGCSSIGKQHLRWIYIGFTKESLAISERIILSREVLPKSSHLAHLPQGER